MSKRPRWEDCIVNHEGEVETFIADYFKAVERRCLFVGGAGFDPRCLAFPRLLATPLGDRLKCVLLREIRPDPQTELTKRADQNIDDLGKLVKDRQILDVPVLAADDGAVIGGRRATEVMMNISLSGYTDVVLDLSALSVGISFPVARYLLEAACSQTPHLNVHLVVMSNAGVDDAIRSIPSDYVDPVHGFSGRLDLEESADQPKIWMPALASCKGPALQVTYTKLRDPVVVCPIIPLSQRDPRASDKLLLEFENELHEIWEVEANNIVYAIEDDPMDLYRTITSIYHRFTQVFEDIETSHVVLTPSGSKTLAIGALLAAIEHNLPVRYVEVVGYTVDWSLVDQAQPKNGRPIHLWFAGDACFQAEVQTTTETAAA
jgi:hypothetical protein